VEPEREAFMAVPKRRTSKSRKHTRRAHDGLTIPSTIRCSRCNTPIERHTICPECGYYRGKPVIAVEEGI
jgi:large subunit ribosomal protein L32